MAFTLSLRELLDIVIMTLVAGFIFMDAFRKPVATDPLVQLQDTWIKRFFYAAGVVAPPIILHELGHKLIAVSYGLTATFKAAYGWLLAGVLIKLINFPFFVMVPAYVSVIGIATPLEHALISLAGPGVNAVLWLVSLILLKTMKMSAGWTRFWSTQSSSMGSCSSSTCFPFLDLMDSKCTRDFLHRSSTRVIKIK